MALLNGDIYTVNKHYAGEESIEPGIMYSIESINLLEGKIEKIDGQMKIDAKLVKRHNWRSRAKYGRK